MPGPMPKSLAIRQRRNKAASRAMLPAELAAERLRTGQRPILPDLPDGKKWHPMARKFWRLIWASPMSFEYLRADEPALLRLMYLVNAFWHEHSLEVAKEIRLMEREFGLTPLSRRQLEWSVATAEEAKDRHEQKRINQAQVVDADPRGVLES